MEDLKKQIKAIFRQWVHEFMAELDESGREVMVRLTNGEVINKDSQELTDEFMNNHDIDYVKIMVEEDDTPLATVTDRRQREIISDQVFPVIIDLEGMEAEIRILLINSTMSRLDVRLSNEKLKENFDLDDDNKVKEFIKAVSAKIEDDITNGKTNIELEETINQIKGDY